jgi:hypothetical protein
VSARLCALTASRGDPDVRPRREQHVQIRRTGACDQICVGDAGLALRPAGEIWVVKRQVDAYTLGWTPRARACSSSMMASARRALSPQLERATL